jgi:hypothetical protein
MPFYRLLAIAALTCAPMCADVTLRYKTAIKLHPSLPAQMAEQMTKGIATAMPADSSFQWKDGKGASMLGKLRSIVDVGKGQMTLIDPEKKRVATVSADQMMEQMTKTMAQMPEEARAAMASMKANSESKVTGRTETIQGIQAEEREVTISINGPQTPNMPPGPMIKMAIQFWTAKQEEVLRVPALRELSAYNIWSFATMNPASSMEKMFQQTPGMGDGMGKFMKDMAGVKAVMLRSRVTMWMPAMAAMMKQAPAGQGPFGADFDPDAPFMEMTQELAELSSAPVPASAVTAPEGYQEVPAEELMREMIPRPPAAAK